MAISILVTTISNAPKFLSQTLLKTESLVFSFKIRYTISITRCSRFDNRLYIVLVLTNDFQNYSMAGLLLKAHYLYYLMVDNHLVLVKSVDSLTLGAVLADSSTFATALLEPPDIPNNRHSLKDCY